MYMYIEQHDNWPTSYYIADTQHDHGQPILNSSRHATVSAKNTNEVPPPEQLEKLGHTATRINDVLNNQQPLALEGTQRSVICHDCNLKEQHKLNSENGTRVRFTTPVREARILVLFTFGLEVAAFLLACEGKMAWHWHVRNQRKNNSFCCKANTRFSAVGRKIWEGQSPD